MKRNRLRNRILCFFVTLLVVFSLFTAAASADSGPWYVDHEYVQRYAEEGISQEVFRKFREHKTEGWYFLGFLSNVTETHSISWTYYPPQNFRVLVYMPKTDTWLISEECSRFAFDSYSPKRLVAYAFTANLVTFVIGLMLPRL